MSSFDSYLLECRLSAAKQQCQDLLFGLKCPVHKLRPRLTYDFDNEFTCAHLTKCCCPDFAKQVHKVLTDAKVIDVVIIDDCEFTRSR